MPFFVYLLKSNSTPTCSSTYIGFSTNPHRRLRQHNGEIAAGAMKTHKYRPWEHICVISGFPSRVVALMFEWQWQHPKSSRILKDRIVGIKYQGKGGRGQLLLLQVLLQSSLWSQLDLCVHFLQADQMSWFRSLPTPASSSSAAAAAQTRCELVDPAEVRHMSERESPTKTAMSVALSFASGSDCAAHGGGSMGGGGEAATGMGMGMGMGMGITINCGLCTPNSSSSSSSSSSAGPVKFQRQLWSCPNCGAAAHVLCSAAAAVASALTDAATAAAAAVGNATSASCCGGGLRTILPSHFTCGACKHRISRVGATRLSFNPSQLAPPHPRSSPPYSFSASSAAAGDDDTGGGGGGGWFADSMLVSGSLDDDEYREEDEGDRDEDIQEEGDEDEDEEEDEREDEGEEGDVEAGGDPYRNYSDTDTDMGSEGNPGSNWCSQQQQQQQQRHMEDLYEHGYAGDMHGDMWRGSREQRGQPRGNDAENVLNGGSSL